MRVVALASGGLDSSLMCLLLKNRGFHIQPLFIDYGQLAGKREFEACQSLMDYLSIGGLEYMDISHFGKKIKSGLTTAEMDITKPYLPNRNLLFLIAASSYAVVEGVPNVAIGLLSTHVFPDQTKEFIESAQATLQVALGTEMNILSPLIGLNKKDILRLAEHHNFPTHLTYSCHMGNEKPCGRCISCVEIENAMGTSERRYANGGL